MRARLSFLLISLLSATLSFSQSRFDSLINVTRQHATDTLGVLAYADLCYEYRFINQDSAIMFGEAGIELGKKLSYKRGLAQVFSDAAFIHFDRGNFTKALSYWKSALKLREELNEPAKIASLCMKLGGAEFQIGQYEKSLQWQMRALRLYDSLKIEQGVAQALNNAAAVYEHQNLLDLALDAYEQAYEIHKKSGSLLMMAPTLVNRGNIYFRKENLLQAKKIYKETVKLLSGQNHPALYNPLAISHNNLSEIHILEQQYDSALIETRTALDLRRKLNDYDGIVSSMNMLGRILTKTGRYAEAEKTLVAALDSARNKSMLQETGVIHQNLHELYKSKGDLAKALAHYISFTDVQDSLLNESGRKQIAELQIKYDTEKKEQQILLQESALLQKEARIERDYVIIIALLITVGLLAVIGAMFRNKQRRKQEILTKEKELAIKEAYIRASIESQEIERKRFAQDLHDGMGQWFSSLKMTLSDINSAANDVTKVAIIERSEKIMEEMTREFRSIAFNLMPHTLIQSGLTPALSEMALRLNTSGRLSVTVNAFDVPQRLPEIYEISLYRIIQEWINNVIKHSNASKIQVQLTGHEEEINIIIEDNGNGFDTSILLNGKGNGWKNILSRLNLIKGTVDIDSNPKHAGTSFMLTIPNPKQSKAATPQEVVDIDKA